MRAYWSAKEKQMLRKLYPEYQYGRVSQEEMERVFGRTLHAIQDQARFVGMKIRATNSKLDEEYYKALVGKLKI
jgi:hypothetical protein